MTTVKQLRKRIRELEQDESEMRVEAEFLEYDADELATKIKRLKALLARRRKR